MNIKYIKGWGSALLLVSVLGLAACGSDDDDSTTADSDPSYTGPTAAVQLSSQVEAKTAVSVATDMAVGDEISGAGVMKAGTVGTVSSSMVGRLADMVELGLSTDRSLGSTMLAGVTQSVTLDCYTGSTVTGSITLTVTYASEFQDSVGDRISMTFNSCSDGIETTNGTMTLTISAIATQDFDGNMVDGAVTLALDELKTTEVATGLYDLLHGDATLGMLTTAANTVQYSLTGNSLLVLDPSHQHLMSNFAFIETVYAVPELDIYGDPTGYYTDYAVSATYDFTLASSEIGGAVEVVTNSPFVLTAISSGTYVDDYPHAGSLTVTGQNATGGPASVRLDVVDNTSVNIFYDLDGNDTWEPDLNNPILWSEMDS